MILVSIISAITPMFIYLSVLWLADKYDKEPIILVALHFIWGGVGAIIFAIFGSMIISEILAMIIGKSELIDAILIAPFVEEITKGIFLLPSALNRKFDNITDGLVYGGAIGLGFGMTENFFYYAGYSGEISGFVGLIMIRTIFTALMHCISTGTLGAFIGAAKYSIKKTNRYIFPFIGISIAIFVHFLWNLLVSFESTALLGLLIMWSLILGFFASFAFSIKFERNMILNELLDEADNKLMPLEHVFIIAHSNRNSKKGWIDDKLRNDYVKTATNLAFRKWQLRNASENDKITFNTEIEILRNRIRELLSVRVENESK